MTNDVETTSILNHKLRDKTGEYVLRQGMPRLLDLYERYGVKATFFYTGYIARLYPDVIRMAKAELLDDDSAFQLEFHCEKKDYFSKKYGMTATHSAVVDAARRVPPSKTHRPRPQPRRDRACALGQTKLPAGGRD